MMIAVIEPLEMVVRARFGHAGRTQVYDCCNGALRGISKGAMASGTCQLRRSRYRVSVLENYRPRKKDKTTYPHQSADQVIKD